MNLEIPPRFIADCHFGKLAKYLRVMGFDTLYFNNIDDNSLVELANSENRIILTRDMDLHKRKKAPTFYIEQIDNLKQLKQLEEHFSLKSYTLKARCIICNTELQIIEKCEVEDLVPQKVKNHFTYFEMCPTCNRIYWHGDHYKRMMLIINKI